MRRDPQRLDAAMQWLLRLRGDEVTEQDISDWARWYESNEGHNQAFDQMQAFWQQVGSLVSDPRRAERIRQLALGPDERQPGNSGQVGSIRRRSRRGWIALALAASLSLTVGVSVLLLASKDVSSPPARSTASTLPPVIRETMLPDGSKVELAAKSSVEVQYTEHRRFLQLEGGEAYFSVAPNRQRPFVVQVGAVKVRAVGTEFNIRKAADRVVVTVTKGIVDVYPARYRSADQQDTAVHPAANGVRVGAGNEVVWAGRADSPTVAAVDPEHALAWKEGRLEYINEPLASVIADVNRYADHPIVIRDPAVARLAFTGTVFIQSTSDWLQSLPSEFPVTLTRGAGDSIVLAPRGGLKHAQ